jgi:hypothetical protein
MIRILVLLTALLSGAFASVAPAFAQATRTWVSGVGDDANPCSRTAPCKTFAGAISKTAAGGEIDALDPGGFGSVTITKSITIRGTATLAGITASGVNGITINAGANDNVVLEDLDINGLGSGLSGVKILSAASVTFDRVRIYGFTGSPGTGIEVAPPANLARVFVRDGNITHNKQGITVDATAAIVRIGIEHSSVVRNNNTGLSVDGANGAANIHDSVFTQNDIGMAVTNSGKIVSMGNNVIFGNITANGAPTSTVPLK